MRVLAVDNDEFILELLQRILDKIGIQDVTVAASAAAAIEILDNVELPFECLILDFQMPEMDGIELCKVVRKMPTYLKTPIIMLSAMNEGSFIERAFAAGATDCATKPFDIVELGVRVRNARQLNSVAAALTPKNYSREQCLRHRNLTNATIPWNRPIMVTHTANHSQRQTWFGIHD